MRNPNKRLIKLADRFQPFDYEYLLQIEEQALKQMADYLDNSSIIIDSKFYASRIRLALKVLHKALNITEEYDVHGSKMRIYVNARNAKRFFPQELSDFNKPSLQAILREEKAWHVYSLIREYDLRKWWD